jgi:hypothetical protein
MRPVSGASAKPSVQPIKGFCGACRRENRVGLTRAGRGYRLALWNLQRGRVVRGVGPWGADRRWDHVAWCGCVVLGLKWARLGVVFGLQEVVGFCAVAAAVA